MIEIVDAGHMTPLEQPEVFAQEIAKWIQQN
jgi:pimeloyl-ACP methyl ester carboxylesterase